MTKRKGWLKITICAAFIALFAAPFLFTSAVKTAAFQPDENDAENPQNCAACHQSNFDSWHQTAHRKTVAKAAAATVRGDFAGENQLNYNGVKVETTRDGANFRIKIGDEIYEIAAVVGAKYIEQYVGEKDGEFYSLPIGYNLSEKRWINLNDADFARKDADFSRHLQNWKTDCAACHQSGANDLPNGFAGFGISCAACHGNAAEHLASKTSVWAKLGFQTADEIINPQNLSSDDSMMICANCHAKDLNKTPQVETPAAGKPLNDTVSAHQPNDFNAEKYWSNGASKFSGSEFQSLLRSVCYVQSKSGGHGIAGAKINCASCHSMHETSVENAAAKSYNQNCVSCHSQFSDANAVVEHTKHSPDSEASSCVSCHQPETIYGRMRFVRTHEISVPNPVLTVEKNVPNACNLCHTDQSANWAIASSKKLWAERFLDAEISPDKQFDQSETLRNLSSDDAFMRALAADALRKHSDFKWSAPFLFEAYQSENSPLVKAFLAESLKIDAPDSSANH